MQTITCVIIDLSTSETWLYVYVCVVYQAGESTVRRAELLSERLASPVLYVLDPDPSFSSTSTDENLGVHHGPCARQQIQTITQAITVVFTLHFMVIFIDPERLTNR